MHRQFVQLVLLGATQFAFAQPRPADGVPITSIPDIWPEQLPDGLGRSRPMPQVLSADWADAFEQDVNIRALETPGEAEIAAAEQRRAARYAEVKPGPARIGFVRTLEAAIFSPGPEWKERTLADGRNAWTCAIQSPAAFNIRVHFSELNLGDSKLVLYVQRNGQTIAHGPYTGRGPENRGEFWSPSLPGDTVRMEVVGREAPRFAIDAIVHDDLDFDQMPNSTRGDCPGVCTCHLDVMCQSSPPVNLLARQATGRMSFVSDGGNFVCTGTMLNDSDAATFVPWFLTAAHCLSTQAEVNTLEVTWFFQSNNTPSNCNASPFVPDPATLPKSFGGTLIYETTPPALTNDACFIRLNPDDLPANAAFAGTTSAQDSGVAGIHHPQGSWKRFCSGVFEDFSIGCGADCDCFDSANYAFYDLTDGIVQGGSSGSGMFNSSGQLLGQLFGHCTLCPDAEDCQHADDWCLMYGEWEETSPEIGYWLTLGGTIWIDRTNPGTANGLVFSPFRRVIDGYNLAWNDTRLMIRTGTYVESLTMNKRITLNAVNGSVRIGG